MQSITILNQNAKKTKNAKYNYVIQFAENANNNNFRIALHNFPLSQRSSVLACFSYFNFFVVSICLNKIPNEAGLICVTK